MNAVFNNNHKGHKINSPKISLIIPVYNVQDYLYQCIESAINQSFMEIEIILVDDGSTDSSGAICDRYKDVDNRIIVIHSEHKGLSSARNIGIDVAYAPYIMFLDGDDWVEPQLCELSYKAAMNYKADMVLFTFNRIGNTGEVKTVRVRIDNGPITELEALDYNVNISPAAWVGLYRKTLFDGIRYPDGRLFEDIGTSHKLIHAANKIIFLNNPFYNHRIGRPGSIGTAYETWSHVDRRDMCVVRINDLISWGYKDFANKDAIYLLIRFGYRGKEQKRYVQIVNEIGLKDLPGLKWKYKIILAFFKISPKLFDYVCIKKGKRIKDLE